ncbi:antitoxin ParD1/3/4 [Neorhizobium huautlense]|uniref:Antitoxin ParD1/3/4 n=1 Tax=Neorhizobium huautlense TaxID=67774 RepID=A0ABT9PYG7_9HYPH|nr:type II toxin-antitoxin system ParD family antitoxin [Neorhizobium huautlense]MDP9839531.1 antitoxin ParD1/3/4 [Neorhizobium huautlense]
MERDDTDIIISLTDDLAEFVQSHVDSGRYQSATDMVRDALSLLQEQDRQALDTERLRRAWREGEASGDYRSLNLGEIKAAARKRFSEGA